MDEILYDALTNYYHVLELTGHIANAQSYKMLILSFYRDFVFNDYKGLLSRDDYRLIDRALNCIYRTSCLISYPDYLKMGNLNLGSTSEIMQRIKALEETNVVKVIHDLDDGAESQSDITIVMEGDE